MNWQGKTLNVTRDRDEVLYFMKQAYKAAEKARGKCSPNPFVGAVIVKEGKVVATGWTQSYGGDHAEVHALKIAGDQAKGADLYVTLEPCSHYGKTSPCAQAIIDAGISRVFAGIRDPNPLVSGQGFAMLKEAGIEVYSGIMEHEISRQLEYHLCRVQKHRPFVIWKAALSLDGRYAAEDGSSRWISGERSRRLVHKLRQEADVVLTGSTTVVKDDPCLNVRLPNPAKQPLRAVLDAFLEIPLHARLFNCEAASQVLLFCAPGMELSSKGKKLAALGVRLYPIPAQEDKLNLLAALQVLHQLGCYCVLLECGSSLASAFFAEKLVDKCQIFYAPKLIGGSRSVLRELPLPTLESAINLRDVKFSRIGDDLLCTGYPEFR